MQFRLNEADIVYVSAVIVFPTAEQDLDARGYNLEDVDVCPAELELKRCAEAMQGGLGGGVVDVSGCWYEPKAGCYGYNETRPGGRLRCSRV